MKLIDLSHTIEDGMVTYKGLPAPLVCDYLSRADSQGHYAPGTTFHIGKIEMVANTGTYIDAPFHRFEAGDDIADLALESLAGLPGVIIDIPPTQRVADLADVSGYRVRERAVLIRTGWDRHWRTDQYFEDSPYLSGAAAEWLRDEGAKLVGTDSLNVDDIADGERPAHTVLLGAGIPIVEHLCRLNQLPTTGFKFSAVPVKVRGMGTFPVRAYATLTTV